MPESLKKLIDIISYLPWIWDKTAARLGFFLLKSNNNYVSNFAKQLERIKTEISECSLCHSYTDMWDWLCSICKDDLRDNSILCVVEDYLDMLSIEKLKIFNWRYHILWGAISPVNWILPKDLNFIDLFDRIGKWNFKEIILAINPNIEGEATCMYIKENIKTDNLIITRLSKWLPNAWYIEYADDITLINAFKGRV